MELWPLDLGLRGSTFIQAQVLHQLICAPSCRKSIESYSPSFHFMTRTGATVMRQEAEAETEKFKAD